MGLFYFCHVCIQFTLSVYLPLSLCLFYVTFVLICIMHMRPLVQWAGTRFGSHDKTTKQVAVAQLMWVAFLMPKNCCEIKLNAHKVPPFNRPRDAFLAKFSPYIVLPSCHLLLKAKRRLDIKECLIYMTRVQ